ncbi:MAG: hypothetical protein R3A47_04640 [Polyangiales bacterium]
MPSATDQSRVSYDKHGCAMSDVPSDSITVNVVWAAIGFVMIARRRRQS